MSTHRTSSDILDRGTGMGTTIRWLLTMSATSGYARVKSAVARVVAPGVAGILVGLLVAYVAGRTSAAPLSASGAAQTRDSSFQRPFGDYPDPAAAGRIDQLLRRIERLEDAAVSPQSAAAPQARSTGSSRTPPDRLSDHLAAVRRHWQENIDRKWSRETTEAVRKDLASLSDRSNHEFSVLNVDCRMTTCIGVVEWPSPEIARRSFPALIHEPYGVNCVRTIVLPPDSDPSAKVQATLLLDCEEQRGNQQ